MSQFTNFLRHASARALLGLLLATPAAALAAEPVEPAKPGPEKGPGPAADERDNFKLPELVEGSRGPLREIIREARRPVFPLAGPVDYGEVEAAFGNARGRPHEGQDIFAPGGTRVMAPRDTVAVDGGSDGGRGNWLALYDRERDQTYSFFHMNAPATVEVGEKVRAGQKVGEVGCTGSCFGDHLHFELREGRGPYGTAIDPLPFLKRAG